MEKRRFTRVFTRAAASAVLILSCVVRPVLAAVPDDPLYAQQWYLAAIGLPDAWEFSKGSPKVAVAVLDSGVDLSHPDLRDRIWTNPNEIAGNGIDDDRNGYVDDVHGWDFVDGDADPNPEVASSDQREGADHGTLVAGIIGAAGNNGEGVSGVSWNVGIMPLRVLDADGAGNTPGVVRAIRYAIAAKAKIINISFTGPNYSQALADALKAAHDAGILVVAAAGNEGDTERGGDLNIYPSYPACYRGPAGERLVLGVASLDRAGLKSSYSSYGSDCVGISAPGESFFSTQTFRPAIEGFEKAYGDSWFGSSLSAPVVSGVAALLASMDPSLDADDLRAFLRATAKSVDASNGPYAGHLGAGQVDASAAVRAVQAALLGGAPPAQPSEPSLARGRLIKLASSSAVYYLGADGRRYVFPNEKTYRSWFPIAPTVRVIGRDEMAGYPLGGNVTYRPGVRMLKIQTDPKIYAVSRNGLLRHVTSEAVAAGLYGPDWNTKIDDISEAFFINYRVGPAIQSVLDYDPEAERGRVPTIDHDKNLLPSGI
ncbi:MAG TPA: S8 family peptidase [Patescibacteria group bacterium]|nr:S8 family peptidase [Patescibacteria group bacterium]